MNTVSFRVFCTRRELGYKLTVYIYPFGVEMLQESIRGKNELISALKGQVAKLTGFFHGSCNKQGVTIKEIELVLPPGNEYVYLQSTLSEYVRKNYAVTLSLSIGSELHNANEDELNKTIQFIKTGNPSFN